MGTTNTQNKKGSFWGKMVVLLMAPVIALGLFLSSSYAQEGSNSNEVAMVDNNYTLSTAGSNSVQMSSKYVFFDFDRSFITSQATSNLDVWVSILKNNKKWKVKVIGYTDNMGREAYNKYISLKRAEEVKQYLVSKGIKKNRIKTEGFGYKANIKLIETEASRQADRRCELILLKR